MTVSQDYDTRTNFQGFRSYSWIPESPGQITGLSQQRIKQAINTQLVNKGLDPLPNSADLFVTYKVDSGGSGKATLTIQILEAKSSRVIWSGWSSCSIRYSDSPDQSVEYINEVVGKIMAQYPPPQK
jgi:hypothetical protein